MYLDYILYNKGFLFSDLFFISIDFIVFIHLLLYFSIFLEILSSSSVENKSNYVIYGEYSFITISLNSIYNN